MIMLFRYLSVLGTVVFFISQKDLEKHCYICGMKVFFQIQIKMVGTRLSLWTVIVNSLKLLSITSISFLPKYEMI